MKESVVITEKEKTEFSPTSRDEIVLRAQHESDRQLHSLMGVIGNIQRDGGTPSVDSIAANLSSMHTTQRAPVLSALQQTHGNLYVTDEDVVERLWDQIADDQEVLMRQNRGWDPLERGFIDLTEDLVVALTDSSGGRLYWLGQGQRGKDLMHFDWRSGTIRHGHRI